MHEQTSHDGEGIEARLQRLERQNGRWRLATVVLLLLAGGALLTAQAPLQRPVALAQPVNAPVTTTALTADKIVLRDAAGRIRARLEMDTEHGGPVLTMADDTGVERLRLGLQGEQGGNAGGVHPAGSFLILQDLSQKPRVILRFAEEVQRRGGQITAEDKRCEAFLCSRDQTTQVTLRCIDDDVMSLTKRYGNREGLFYAKFFPYEK
jgi:hypothetical protein